MNTFCEFALVLGPKIIRFFSPLGRVAKVIAAD